jgi:glycosyltransferase involved in cell wall biosynthesis
VNSASVHHANPHGFDGMSIIQHPFEQVHGASMEVDSRERSTLGCESRSTVPRVLHILWSGDIGGAERAVYHLALHQRRSGCAHAEIGFGHARGQYCGLARESGIPVIDFALQSGRDFGAIWRATSIFSAYDIHHFHVVEPVLMLASMRTSAVRVYTHRAGRIEYRGRRAMRYSLVSPMIRRFHAITGTAQATSAIPALFGVPEHRVHRTWNGVDPELFVSGVSREEIRARHGFASDAVLVGTAARLRKLKRVDLLLEAAGALKPQEHWKIVVLGDGPDRARLEHLACLSPAAERIEFVGMQPRIGDWLSALDVFVLPSGPEESFGNAAVEAMAAGLPTIVFADSPALVEHVMDGKTGFIVQSTAELARRLQELVDDRGLRERLGAAASAFARTKYSLEQVVERFDAIYDAIRSPAHEVEDAS